MVLSGELRWAAFGETEDQENLLEGYHVFAIATRRDPNNPIVHQLLTYLATWPYIYILVW